MSTDRLPGMPPSPPPPLFLNPLSCLYSLHSGMHSRRLHHKGMSALREATGMPASSSMAWHPCGWLLKELALLLAAAKP